MIFAGCSYFSKNHEVGSNTWNFEKLVTSDLQKTKKTPKVTNQRMPTSSWPKDARGYDHCYQLYVQGAMYPVICMDGTANDTINGAGALMVVFHTNTDMISACARASALESKADGSFSFIADGSPQFILSNIVLKQGRSLGDALIGRTALKFMTIDKKDQERLMKKALADRKCTDVGIGKIVNFKN